MRGKLVHIQAVIASNPFPLQKQSCILLGQSLAFQGLKGCQRPLPALHASQQLFGAYAAAQTSALE